MSTLKVTNLQHPSSASANVTLDSSGNATFGGNGVFAGALTGVTDLTASGGIYLGGTGSSNKISDYEQGTWTPTIAGSPSNPGTYTYVEQQGHYVKIGNQVTAWFNLTNITTSSAGSGHARLSGLPFAANWQSGFNGESTGVVGVNDFSGIAGLQTYVSILDDSTLIYLYHFTGTDNNVDTVDIQDKASDSADVRGFVTYYTGG